MMFKKPRGIQKKAPPRRRERGFPRPIRRGSKRGLRGSPNYCVRERYCQALRRHGSDLRWGADIATLIRTRETDINWWRLIALAKQYSCLALVKESIEDVFAVMGMRPDDARAILRAPGCATWPISVPAWLQGLALRVQSQCWC
jgi:hypothetical protein